MDILVVVTSETTLVCQCSRRCQGLWAIVTLLTRTTERDIIFMVVGMSSNLYCIAGCDPNLYQCRNICITHIKAGGDRE